MALTENGHSHALIPVEQEAVQNYRVSTNAATLCSDIVKATATKIQNKRYVGVEGWLALAAAHGCLVSIREVRSVDGGVMAVAELRRISDQALLATAEGFVGDDEPMWAKRPMFARRAMAQTRASSRVCRAAFAFVVVLIDKDLGTTPAEEMQGAIEAEQVHVIGGDIRPVDPQDQHLVQGDGTSNYKLTAAKKAKDWADMTIGTLNLSAHTRDSLMAFWKENAKALGRLEDKHPEQYERVVMAYDSAMEAAEAKEPAAA